MLAILPAFVPRSEGASDAGARRFSRPDGNLVYLAEAAGRECSHPNLPQQMLADGSSLVDTPGVAGPTLDWLRKVACFLIFTSITKKQCQISFLLTQHFRFLLLFLAAAEVEPGVRVCLGTAATPVHWQGQSCLHSNFIHHVLVCTAQQ